MATGSSMQATTLAVENAGTTRLQLSCEYSHGCMLSPLAFPDDCQPSVRYLSANVRFCYASRRSFQVIEFPKRVENRHSFHEIQIKLHN